MASFRGSRHSFDSGDDSSFNPWRKVEDGGAFELVPSGGRVCSGCGSSVFVYVCRIAPLSRDSSTKVGDVIVFCPRERLEDTGSRGAGSVVAPLATASIG